MMGLQIPNYLKVLPVHQVKVIRAKKKAKNGMPVFFSSVEGDFSWPVTSFPMRQMNSAKLQVLVWNVVEVLPKTFVNGKHI